MSQRPGDDPFSLGWLPGRDDAASNSVVSKPYSRISSTESRLASGIIGTGFAAGAGSCRCSGAFAGAVGLRLFNDLDERPCLFLLIDRRSGRLAVPKVVLLSQVA